MVAADRRRFLVCQSPLRVEGQAKMTLIRSFVTKKVDANTTAQKSDQHGGASSKNDACPPAAITFQ